MSANGSGNQRYRLIVIDDETLEKLRSFKISKRAIILWITSIVLTVIALTAVLIWFTPIKSLVPGYSDYSKSPEYRKISKKIVSMNSALEAQSYYITQLQQLISGTPAEVDDSLSVAADLDLAALATSADFEEVSEYVDTEVPAERWSLSQVYLIPPVDGDVSQNFMENTGHLGVDIVCPLNTPVKSTLPGYVILSDWTIETGYTIGVQHEYGLLSFYKHNSSVLKQTGDYVLAGEVIAITGNTGDHSDGPHLHFELWRNGKPIDPRRYISW